MNQLLGPRIRSLREKLGLSRDELAKRAGLHRNTLLSVEHGRGSPTLDTVEAIARALGTRMTTLLRDERP